jgi:hypothetical protein
MTKETALDLLGYEVRVGDKVVISRPGYSQMVIGIITKITPRKVLVQFRTRDGRIVETFRTSNMFVKAHKE